MNQEIKILCVDDEVNVLNALKRLFLDEDYIILTANSGQEGLDILKSEELQIIISDYRMPVMNGVEFLKEARTIQPDTVRIVLSGYADAGAIVSAINEGQIYKFIPKPWNDDELKVTISNAIERYNLFKQNKMLTETLKARNEELSVLNKRLESLLDEKSKRLEFTSEVLNTHQSIIDSIPIGIIGIDLNNDIVLANKLWNELNTNPMYVIGSNISQTPLRAFTDKLLSKHQCKDKDKDRIIVESSSIFNTKGKIVGCFFLDATGQRQGVILALIDENVIYS